MDILLKFLGLTKDTEYKKAYRRYLYLVKKHHPDKGGDADTFRRIVEAWGACKEVFPKRHLKNYIALYVSEEEPDIYMRYFAMKDGYTNWLIYKKVEKDTYRLTDKYFDLARILNKNDIELKHQDNCYVETVDDPTKCNVFRINMTYKEIRNGQTG